MRHLCQLKVFATLALSLVVFGPYEIFQPPRQSSLLTTRCTVMASSTSGSSLFITINSFAELREWQRQQASTIRSDTFSCQSNVNITMNPMNQWIALQKSASNLFCCFCKKILLLISRSRPRRLVEEHCYCTTPATFAMSAG